jgi:hypothetical protein
MNYKLNELTENADIVRFIKKNRRIAWLGHVMRKRRPKRILEWKPHSGHMGNIESA